MRVGESESATPTQSLFRSFLCATFAICCLLPVGPAAGHGDPNQRILVLSKRIQAEPGKAPLYIARGRLYRGDGHYTEALRDFERAAQLDPALGEADYLRGVTLLQMARPADSKWMLDRYIRRHPKAPLALVARARARVLLQDYVGASADFSGAIFYTPIPDYYLERARALAAAGPGFIGEAVRGLDQGLARLGMLTALQRLAIDLDVARRNFDGAARRVDEMAMLTGRPDIWFSRKGDIFLAAERDDAAREAYRAALAAIPKLHPRHRGSTPVRDLKRRLQAFLNDGPARRAGNEPTPTFFRPKNR